MAAVSEATLRVLSAGPGTALQDAGRHGYLRFGVTGAGPMDWLAHATANLAVGNPAGTAALEVSVGGIEVTAEAGPISVAVAGGEFCARCRGAEPAAGRRRSTRFVHVGPEQGTQVAQCREWRHWINFALRQKVQEIYRAISNI